MSNAEAYVFFYSTKPKLYPEGCKHYVFSQWYKSDFTTSDGTLYKNMEQYMMAQKALLFEDYDVLSMIMSTTNPYDIKRFGRQVKGFNDDVWKSHRTRIVYEGNLLKFSQNEQLKQILLETGTKTIVEASPSDRIWGIGLSVEKARVTPESKWKGLNLLGKALMEVRTTLLHIADA